MSPRIRDSLAAIHQRTLELIVRGASLQDVLGALCDGIDALDPDLVASVLLTDAGGQHLWPAAGRRVPEDYKELIRCRLLRRRSFGTRAEGRLGHPLCAGCRLVQPECAWDRVEIEAVLVHRG